MKRFFLFSASILISLNSFAQETEIQKEERRRAFINDFINTYVEAYEKQKIEYISAFFSSDALIITETKQLVRNGSEIAPKSTKKRPYALIVEDKKQYLVRLKKIFDLNEKIQLSLSDLRVMKHPKYPEIYGIAFTQMWKDQGGGDNLEDDMEGYVFLLMDFKGMETTPVLHVRTWQPYVNIKSPIDKYTISDFHIYETGK